MKPSELKRKLCELQTSAMSCSGSYPLPVAIALSNLHASLGNAIDAASSWAYWDEKDTNHERNER